jgi:hypothetical protein
VLGSSTITIASPLPAERTTWWTSQATSLPRSLISSPAPPGKCQVGACYDAEDERVGAAGTVPIPTNPGEAPSFALPRHNRSTTKRGVSGGPRATPIPCLGTTRKDPAGHRRRLGSLPLVPSQLHRRPPPEAAHRPRPLCPLIGDGSERRRHSAPSIGFPFLGRDIRHGTRVRPSPTRLCRRLVVARFRAPSFAGRLH